MTNAVTSFTVHITESGECYLDAPDADADGHLWAISRTPVTIGTVRRAAAALGNGLPDGVERRLAQILTRQRQLAGTLDARVRTAQAARDTVTHLEQVLGRD